MTDRETRDPRPQAPSQIDRLQVPLDGGPVRADAIEVGGANYVALPVCRFSSADAEG